MWKKFFGFFDFGQRKMELFNEYHLKRYEEEEREKRVALLTTKRSMESMDIDALRVKEKLDTMGCVDLMLITENVDVPKLSFKYKNIIHLTDCIYDFSYDAIMKNIYLKISEVEKRQR